MRISGKSTAPLWWQRTPKLPAALAVAFVLAGPAMPESGPAARQRQCLALIAYAEAAAEGVKGMAAVIQVVRNRTHDDDFPEDACEVVAQDGQFQPLNERPYLRRAVSHGGPLDLERLLDVDTGFTRMMLRQARGLAAADDADTDPTGGALFFVNPDLMDPERCPWFAQLRRTTKVGNHVFLREYADGETRRGPALNCNAVGKSRYLLAAKAKRKTG